MGSSPRAGVRSVLVGLVVLAVHGSLVFARQQPPRDGSVRPPAPPIVVRGRVVAEGTDVPLRRVRIVPQSTRDGGPVFTDEQGRFEITLPGSSTSNLRLNKPGYVPLTVDRQALAGGDLTLRMAKGAAITGMVIDPLGAPAVAVRVRVRRVADPSGAPVRGGSQYTVETDDLGEFRVGNLPAGRYAASVLMPGARGGRGQPNRAGGAARNGGRGRGGGRGAEQPVDPNEPTVMLGPGEEAPLLVIADASATAPVEEPPAPAPAARSRTDTARSNVGAIRGRVLTQDGRPLERARVQLVSVDEGGSRRSAVSDAEGRYALTEVPAGRYRLRVSRPGLGEVEYGQSRAMQAGRIIELPTGANLQGLDVTMPRPSAVIGTVRDQTGEPIEGATVEVWQVRYTDGRTTLSPAGSVRSRQTDDRGRYRLYGLLPGTYYVVTSDPTTRRGGGRGGRGGGGSSAGMRLFYPGTPYVANALPVRIDPGLDASGIDIVAEPVTPGRISGVATSTTGQTPRGRAVLAVSQRSGAPLLPLRTATLSRDGTFEFTDVAPGEYVVQVMTGETGGRGPNQNGGRGGRGGRGRAAVATVLLQDGQQPAREFGTQYVSVGPGAARVHVEVSPVTSMSGEIRLDGDATGLAPAAFGFEARPADQDLAPLTGVRTLRATVREDWTFEMSGLAGSLRFVPTRVPEGWWLESVSVNGMNGVRTPVLFWRDAIPLTNVTAVFASGTGSIEGQVLDAGRVPAAEFAVIVFAADSERWYSGSPYVKFASPSHEGTFSVTGLPPGDYYAVAVDRLDGTADYGDWQNPAVLSALAPAGRSLRLGRGQHLTTELRLVALPQ